MRYLWSRRLASSRSTPGLDGDEVLVGHQVGDLHVEIGGEAHVAVGDDADELAAAIDHRNAGDAVALLQRQHVAQRRVGRDGDGVHHHARFEALHLAHMLGLLVRARGSCG